MRQVTAVLRKHQTDDGLVVIYDHVPIGKTYEVDLDTITVLKMHNTIEHKDHEKESIYLVGESNRFIPTELLFIPGYTQT